MTVSRLLERLKPRRVQGPVETTVLGVAGDSRQVRPGFLFVALPGHTLDGTRFVGDAVDKGAIAVLAESPLHVPPHVCRIEVDDARAALGQVAKAFWGDAADRLALAGVTGTNGKTTVAYLVRDILERAGRQPGLLSTVQYRVGARIIPAQRTTPEAPVLHRLLADMVAGGCLSAVMEVSSHALAQKRVEGLAFDAAVFTNLTRDHLDYHVTMDAYFEAKAQLFDGLARQTRPAHAVINQDDDWGKRLRARVGTSVPVLTYGLEPGAVVGVEGLVMSAAGSRFELHTPWGRTAASLRLLGRHNVSNALAACAAAGAMGVPLETIVAALAQASGAPGRLQEVHTGRGFQVFVDYAHSDDALAHVLGTVREVTEGRVLLVFGCGGNRDTSKRAVMGAVAARLADQVVVTSDNPRLEAPEEIIAQILQGAPGAKHLDVVVDRRDAIARAIALARPGDLVLIAGKGHEPFQEVGGRVIPFDDVQVAGDLLAGGQAG